MAQKSLQDIDVLQLEADMSSDASFSGFSEDEVQKTQLRSAVSVVGEKKKGKKSSDKQSSDKSLDKNRKPSGKKSSDRYENKTHNAEKISSDRQEKSNFMLDVSKLSPQELESLRGALGFQPEARYYDEEQNFPNYHENYEPEDWQYEPMTIRVNANDISDTEDAPRIDFQEAMFGKGETNDNVPGESSDDIDWQPPKLKAPELGEPISASLAQLINVACTKQCETDFITANYKVPSNCESSMPPAVNQRIWKTLNKYAHKNDTTLLEIQNLVATGFGPIIRLADHLKGKIDTEAQKIMSDLMTILGQVQFNLSIRRRYFLRPYLKYRYQSLCSISTPVTKNLFGDSVNNDIKSCEYSPTVKNFRGFGYGYGQGRGGRGGRPSRRPYYPGGHNPRFTPYPQAYPPVYPQYPRGQSRGLRPRRRVSATATAPNDL